MPTLLLAVSAALSSADGTALAQVLISWGQCGSAPPGPSDVLQAAIRNGQVMMLRHDGTVTDQSGNALPGLPQLQRIATSGTHSLGIRLDGTVVAWGLNNSGECVVPPALSDVRFIAASSYSLAIRQDGLVVAWGSYADVPASLTHASEVSLSGSHNLAIRDNGSIAAWGYNAWGQCNVPPGLSGVRHVLAAAVSNSSFAIRNDGTVARWGDPNPFYNPPAGLRDVIELASGIWHFVALRADGTIACWGAGRTNDYSFPNYGQSMVPPYSERATHVYADGYSTYALICACSVLDHDGDGTVGTSDLALTLLDFGACAGCASDLDGDGVTDIADVSLLLLEFGPCSCNS